MKQLVFFAVLLTCLSFCKKTTAQSTDVLKSRYENETLHFFKGYISKGQNAERILKRDLGKEFSMSPEAATEFDLYKKKRTTTQIMATTALALIIAGGIVANSSKDLGAGLMLGGLALDLITIPISFEKKKHLSRAVWLRNRDVVFGK